MLHDFLFLKQMQNNREEHPQQVIAQESPVVEVSSISQSQHNLLVTPDVPSPMPKFSWETPPWNAFVQPNPDQSAWSPGTPQSMLNFGLKPMIASAPVTPDVVPYHSKSLTLFIRCGGCFICITICIYRCLRKKYIYFSQ